MSQQPQTTDAASGASRVRAALWALIVVCIAGIIACVAYLYVKHLPPMLASASTFDEGIEAAASSVAADDEADQVTALDFDKLAQLAENTDVYAWVHVSGTSVSTVVCQSPTNDAFYADHDATGAQDDAGCAYSEASANTTSFDDAVTVLYGNNNDDGSGFASLHNFEDASFFDEHDSIRVYSAGHVHTYRIVSAFTADDMSLMTRYYYFTKQSKHKEFLKLMQDPTGLSANKRDVDGIDTDSKVLVLSTQNGGALAQNSRYLVCGVMVDDRAA